MTWLYNDTLLEDELIPEKAVGFIYMMIYAPTGQRYIGRKLLTKAHRRQKDKKIIRSRVASDWKDYWSSSPEIKIIIEQEGGTHNFTRQVLAFAANKSQLNYMEECLQYTFGVLESNSWMNSNIRSKAYKRNIINKPDIIVMREIIKVLSSQLV